MFKSGNSKLVYPIRVNWLETELVVNECVQVAFTVPKRFFKSAVKRNLIRRKMKEAYRLHQNKLRLPVLQANRKFAVLFIYSAKEILSFTQIEQKTIKAISKFIQINELDS